MGEFMCLDRGHTMSGCQPRLAEQPSSANTRKEKNTNLSIAI